MALILDNSQAVQTLQVNAYLITDFSVSIKGQFILVQYDEGSLSNGAFTKMLSKAIKLELGDFASIAMASVDGSKDLYDNLKVILYDKLIYKLGLAGTIL